MVTGLLPRATRCKPARHAYDRARWADARSKPGGIVLVTHDSGGGVERHVTERAAAIVAAGTRAIVVRPATGPDGETDGEPAIGYVVSDGPARTHPNLIFPDAQSLATFLRDDHPSAVELHHTASHKAGIERLAGLLRVPFDIVVHDYAAICPRVTLCGGTGAYCGLPADSSDCDDCIADNGARIPFAGSVGDFRATQSILFGAARRVVVPANDAALRLARIMPRLQPVVGAWEAGAAAVPLRKYFPNQAPRTSRSPAPSGRTRATTCCSPARGTPKGATLPCASPSLATAPDDERLLRTGRVFITGPFAEGEAPALLRQTGAAAAFLPSVWPETWCYALSALWEAGAHRPGVRPRRPGGADTCARPWRTRPGSGCLRPN